ncbi:putative secreted protein, partial [hydrothermal vent metagenome]
MTAYPVPSIRLLTYAYLSTMLLSVASGAAAQNTPIVQPGAPGEALRELSAEQAIAIADSSYSPDDAAFMQDMIPHHNQAVQMAALVADRTNRQELLDVAGRIDASQKDEIKFMQQWLRARGETIPEPTAHDAMRTSHSKAGMASPEQMAQLASEKSTGFDRLFLELMIAHHKGAVKMVKELHKQPGSAYDPILFEFTNDVVNDQTAEIERMDAVLASISTDARANLAAGFKDAGQAIMNLELIASLPRPRGFFDPQNPMELAPAKPQKDSDKPSKKDDNKWGKRSPLLSFSNTDMAFSGDKLVVGSYHGFNIYQLQKDGVPILFSSIVCPGGQGDVSIVGDLLIMSAQETRGRVDCGLQGVAEDVSAERFRGLRIFDISDPARPVQVGQVQTCRGSHTHSVVSGPGKDGKIIVYNSGTSSVRKGKELEGCVGNIPGDDRTALFRIDVIEIPVDDPSKARIIDSPAVFADPKTGRLAGLWQGGDHGDDTQKTNQTNQCHDITVFPELKIAAGACSGNGIIFDISDPLKPKRIDEVLDKGFAYWHSATFNNDGSKVLFTDEWGGGGRPRCLASDPKEWGADAIYDIVDGQLEFKGYYKLPAPQVEQENCVAHNGSIIPVPGRDIFVQAWYQGGLSVIDFTDSANPVEIAYFDRGPIHEKRLVVGGYWSTYWYNGKIYGSEIVRGLDVMALAPSAYLSENEIAAAALADQGGVFNPQQQFRVTWPAEPVVARAYIDQLQRSEGLSPSLVTELTT